MRFQPDLCRFCEQIKLVSFPELYTNLPKLSINFILLWNITKKYGKFDNVQKQLTMFKKQGTLLEIR